MLLVGIPAHNEAAHIAAVVLEARDYADDVIVVDDGSTDRTRTLAEKAGATVVSHDSNRGKGAALRTLFLEARKRGCDVLVTLDGDGQHSPSDILAVAAQAMSHDLVIGTRPNQGGSIIRRLARRILSPSSGLDSQSGFRAYNRRAISALDWSENGMASDEAILAVARRAGLSIVQVPITCVEDGLGFHKTNPITHFTDLLGASMKRAAYERPLRALGIPGALLMIGGGVGWGVTWNLFQTYHELPMGIALGSSVLIMLGFFMDVGALVLFAIRLQILEVEGHFQRWITTALEPAGRHPRVEPEQRSS